MDENRSVTEFALPSKLRRGIEDFCSDVSGHEIAERAKLISENYVRHKPSRMAITTHADVAAYLVARAPATFAACAAAFAALRARAPSLSVSSVLDIGAGPGTASWAAMEQWPNIDSIMLVDENRDMLNAARILCAGADVAALRDARIECTQMSGAIAGGSYDLVVASYAMGELPSTDIQKTLQNFWRSAKHALVVIEPGTPEGFARIHAARNILAEAGAEIAAPCPHSAACPMAAPDWCHFGQRLPRSRNHMRAKGARLPFEDEKFSYVAAIRDVWLRAPEPRIIDRPKAEKSGMNFRLCGETGLSTRRVLKRDKPAYRAVRHRKWGDTLPS